MFRELKVFFDVEKGEHIEHRVIEIKVPKQLNKTGVKHEASEIIKNILNADEILSDITAIE